MKRRYKILLSIFISFILSLILFFSLYNKKDYILIIGSNYNYANDIIYDYIDYLGKDYKVKTLYSDKISLYNENLVKNAKYIIISPSYYELYNMKYYDKLYEKTYFDDLNIVLNKINSINDNYVVLNTNNLYKGYFNEKTINSEDVCNEKSLIIYNKASLSINCHRKVSNIIKKDIES